MKNSKKNNVKRYLRKLIREEVRKYKLFENGNRLQKIIDDNDNLKPLQYSRVKPYLKQLYVYYKDYFQAEPILMVDVISNALQAVLIVSSHEFDEVVDEYLDNQNINDPEDREYQKEKIALDSKMLKDYIR